MSKAVSIPTTKLSSIIRDPMVAEAFARAEREDGADCFAVTDHPPQLDRGAAEALTGSGTRRVRVLELA
jgi:hypothetical protein